MKSDPQKYALFLQVRKWPKIHTEEYPKTSPNAIKLERVALESGCAVSATKTSENYFFFSSKLF